MNWEIPLPDLAVPDSSQTSLSETRAAAPAAFPDQAIYAAFAARRFGLTFTPLDGDGLAFRITSQHRRIVFGGGRCSYYPQNNAAAATLAADKYLAAVVLEAAGVPTLGGTYFFLSERHRALRPAGHERGDAIAQFHAQGGTAFVKPLLGSRGDFAQAVHDEAALRSHLDATALHHDSIIMQRIVHGDEYRVFVLDDAVLYTARKDAPFVVGDGITPLRDLLAQRDAALVARGISGAASSGDSDAVLPLGERFGVPGRMNRSAGGEMMFETPPDGAAKLAIAAVQALGLRAGGVDLFTSLDGDAAMRVIEINANPSIRFLEESGRDDLILAIWRHTFTATGLIDV